MLTLIDTSWMSEFQKLFWEEISKKENWHKRVSEICKTIGKDSSNYHYAIKNELFFKLLKENILTFTLLVINLDIL